MQHDMKQVTPGHVAGKRCADIWAYGADHGTFPLLLLLLLMSKVALPQLDHLAALRGVARIISGIELNLSALSIGCRCEITLIAPVRAPTTTSIIVWCVS